MHLARGIRRLQSVGSGLRRTAPAAGPALLCVVVFATLPAAGVAGTRSCERPTLHVPRRSFVNGEAITLAGSACPGRARIVLNVGRRWKSLGAVRITSRGRFAKRVRVRVARRIRLVDLRVVARASASRRVRLRVQRLHEHRLHSHRKPEAEPITSAPETTETTETAETAPEQSVEAAPTDETVGLIGAPASEPPAAEAETPSAEAEPEPEAPPVGSEPEPEAPPAGSEPEPEVPPAEAEPEAESPPAEPEAEAAPASSCPSGPEPTVAVAMTSTGCPTVASDTGAGSPLSFWGSIQCAESSRYQTIASGGAPEPTATGEPQGNSSYRQMTLFDGDNFYGARCELGLNDYRSGPTAFYHEGERAVTYYSERLPSNFPLSTTRWQTVMQMKQAQPSHDDGGGVAIEMEARHGRWVVEAGWKELWSFPAKAGSWTRFAWDVYYSKDPAKGWLQVSADLNGDGSFEGPGERSPVLHTATLATEVSGYPGDGIPAGAAIPSHLRMGIYHDPAISCPAPQGCSVDVDDVQVVR